MGKGVSKNHTQQQRNDYANQYNPNNSAYDARIANNQKTQSNASQQSRNDRQNNKR